MNNNDIKKITKYILVLGVVLCGISFIVPWGNSNFGIGEYSFYCWGINFQNPIYEESELISYLQFVDINYLNDYFGLDVFKINPVILIIGLLVFFILLISLSVGIIALRNIIKNRDYYDDTVAGFGCIFAVIFFYFFIEFGILNMVLLPTFNYSIGFYLAIISAILFILSFIIKNEFLKPKKKDIDIKSVDTKNFDMKALELLNERYVKGEINKKEYIEKKKDILE